jgi:hypothetical protein
MKYQRLTREQLEEMEEEFVNFLATQSITAEEWQKIKQERPEVAEQEIDVFSDLIWEGILGRVRYLENIGPNHMHLFHLEEKEMKLIATRIHAPAIDITTQEGFAWFKSNYLSEQVEYMTAVKAYSEDPSLDKFKLIQQGAVITRGELFQWFEEIIEI